MRTLLTLGIGVALLTASASAQRLAVYDPTSTGGPGILEVIPPTRLLPPGAPPVLVYPEIPPLLPPPAFVVPPGGATFDGINGFHFYTNGLDLAATPTPAFPPSSPVPPAIVPFPAAILGAIGGPVTGIAISPGPIGVPGTLYAVSATGIVVGVTVTPAGVMVIVVQPFPIPFLLPQPITGLEFDAMTNRLLAVDVLGNVYPFTTVGVAAGPMIPVPAGLPNTATAIAIDKTGMFNGWGMRPIYVLFGLVFADITTPFANPPVYPTVGSPAATGLAYLPHPADFPPGGICPCPTFPITQSVTSMMTAGNPAFGFQLSGLPPGQIALIAFDFNFNPLFPLINGIGNGFGFSFTSPTLNSTAIFADGFGNAIFPLPLFAPAGLGPIFYQAGTFCPADLVLGVVVTPMYQFSASGL